MNFKNTYILVFILFFSASVSAQEETKIKFLEFRAYLKNLQMLSFDDNVASLSSSTLFHNRLNFKFNFSNEISARLEIRNRIFYGDQVKLIPEFGKMINQYNGLMDLSVLWVDEKTIVVHSVIDRLQLQYTGKNWDVKLGRQRINWGINNVWNPNDIFNAYNILDFDYEERPGTDAIRIQHYFKTNSGVEIAFKPGKHKNESIGAALYKTNKWKYDFQVLAGVFQSDVVIGTGWAGNIKNAGFKGEVSYFHPHENSFDTSGVVSFSLMADQTFKNDWYISVGGLYNSHPSNNFMNSGNIFSSNTSAKELFPFRYTFYAGILKSFSPITSLNFSVIYSPEKNTLILFPSFAWNVAQNFDLDITAQSLFSELSNKFSFRANSFFLRGKWSF